jgi:multidrug efflux system membrane fusion protein
MQKSNDMTATEQPKKTETHPSPSPSPASAPPPARGHKLWWVLGLVAVGLVVLFFVRRDRGEKSAAQKGAAAGGAPGADGRVVPVLTAQVERKDVPIYLEGLGSVTALKTVTVRARVDGQLDSVVFKEGQAVKKGSLLAQIDPRPFEIQLHQAQAALARDSAQMQGAQRDLDRYVVVGHDKLIAQQQVDDQRALVEQLRGTVQNDEAAIESAKLQLVYARITSPIDGVTGIRLVDQGNVVHAADTGGIVVLTELDPIALIFTLPEDDLPRVAKRLAEGPLTVTALSRDGGTDLGSGQVTLIDNQINVTTATIRVKAELPNPGHALWPNQFVKARLLLETRHGALVVAAAAVQRGPNGSFAYVVGPDNKAVLRPLQVDSLAGDLAIVSKGLSAGEAVVIEGQSQLRPGAAVSARPRTGAGAGADQGGGAAPPSGRRGGAGAGAGGHAGGGQPPGGGHLAQTPPAAAPGSHP